MSEMTWEEFKKDAEALDDKPSKNLGICDVFFGCIKGNPYIEIYPIVSRVKSEKRLMGIIFGLHGIDINNCHKDAIIELNKNASEINDLEGLQKSREELLKRRKEKANAIKDLEI